MSLTWGGWGKLLPLQLWGMRVRLWYARWYAIASGQAWGSRERGQQCSVRRSWRLYETRCESRIHWVLLYNKPLVNMWALTFTLRLLYSWAGGPSCRWASSFGRIVLDWSVITTRRTVLHQSFYWRSWIRPDGYYGLMWPQMFEKRSRCQTEVGHHWTTWKHVTRTDDRVL